MMRIVFICLVILVNTVELVPTFNISLIVQESVWPEVNLYNDTKENDQVRIRVDKTDITDKNIIHLTSTVCDVASKSTNGFVLFVDCTTVKVLEQLSIFRHRLAIVVTNGFCDVTSKSIIKLRPPCSYSNSLLASIAEYKEWYNILLFHDKTLNSNCVIDLLRQLSLKSAKTRIVNTDKYNSTKQYLHYLTRYQPDGIFILAKESTVTDILQQVVIDRHIHHSWVIMTGSIRLPLINGTSDYNIVFLRENMQNTPLEQESCTEWYSQDEESAAFSSDAMNLVLEHFSEIVSKYNITEFEPVSCYRRNNKNNQTFVRDIIDAMLISQHSDNIEYQICSTDKSEVSLKEMGTWSSKKGLLLKNKKLFGNDFIDFRNATLKVAALPLTPYVFFNTDENNMTTYSGFCIEILNQLSLKYKFNYEIVSPSDNNYGGPEEDGTWNGMVGMVMRKEADFAAGPFTITSIRESVVDFTIAFMEEGVGILTLRPNDDANKEYQMFKPMSITVWIAIGVAIVITGIFLFIANRYSPYSSQHDSNSITGMLSSSMWLIYGAFMEQGDDPRPSSASGRTMLSCWWVFTILILSTYTANLAAYLTVTILESPVNSLEELANNGQIDPLIISGTNLQTLFQTARTGLYAKIWSKMEGMPIVNEVDIALSYVRQGKYAFLADYSLLDYIMLQDCKVYAVADEKFNTAGVGFVLQEKSNYLDAFNLAILKMTEAGFIKQWRNKWWPRSNSCTSSYRSSSAQSLGMDSLLGLFYIYFGSVGLAMVVFLIEIFCNTDIFKKKCLFLSSKLKKTRNQSISKTSSTTSLEMTALYPE